jgi:predicted RNA polymerase sigma factor
VLFIGTPTEQIAEPRARLDEVCRTIYLAFTAGYTPGSGPDLLRADLTGDAVRLAAVLHELAHRAGDIDMARASYRKAIELCANEAERAHLTARLRALPEVTSPAR